MNQNSPIFIPSRQERLAKYHHTDDGYIYSLRAIIKNDQGQILMMYDSRYDAYTVPGGKWEVGDDTMLDSLQREVFEEIGCTIVDATLLGSVKCLRAGMAVCHVSYEVTINTLPQLGEIHMTSLHRCSFIETHDYLGYDIVMDGKPQFLSENIILMLKLFDLVEYHYHVGIKGKNDVTPGEDVIVHIPDASSMLMEDCYLTVLKNNQLLFIPQSERGGEGYVFYAQLGKDLLTGMQKVYMNI